jgi:uncharacterized protein YndB with AHSA1/START domain
MSVRKEPSGRRSVAVEVEVPGTVEEVWQAIATGPGVSSWFVPTEVEVGDDGKPVKVVSHFGPGMDSVARITEWDPPHRMTAASDDLGPGAPSVATEWIVEARAGDTCVVRVVHSLFASTEDWDDQLVGWESGWPFFFRILRLYLTHFRGQHAAALRVMGAAPEPDAQAWAAFGGALGLAGAGSGQRWSSSGAGAPRLGGTIEEVTAGEKGYSTLLRLDQPRPGIASLFALPMGGRVYLVMDLFLYGDHAAATIERDGPAWRAWMEARFPAATDPGETTG